MHEYYNTNKTKHKLELKDKILVEAKKRYPVVMS